MPEGEERSAQDFSADALPPAEIAALKDLERQNRDRGAPDFLSGLVARRGVFQLEAEQRTYLRYLDPRRGESFLDAGAGVGRIALLIAPRVKRLLCLDHSTRALDLLRAEADRRGIANLETRPADLCRLSLEPGEFDAAYSIEVVQHIPSHAERQAAVRNLHRVLRPGARCLISVSSWNWRSRRDGDRKEGFWRTAEGPLYMKYFTPAELGGLLEEAGFHRVRVRGLIILPGKLTRRWPASLAGLETGCSRLTFLAGAGRLVFAIGER